MICLHGSVGWIWVLSVALVSHVPSLAVDRSVLFIMAALIMFTARGRVGDICLLLSVLYHFFQSSPSLYATAMMIVSAAGVFVIELLACLVFIRSFLV